MSQDYYGRSSRYQSSWSVIDEYPSYATDTWSVLNSQDVNEEQLPSLPQNHHGGGLDFNNYGSSTISTIQQEERNPSPPPYEPEFPPSISNSTKGFIETTYKYERKRQEDIVGRPEEYDEYDNAPPSQLSSDKDIQPSLFSDDSQSMAGSITPSSSSSLPSSSYRFVWYSLVILVIGVIIYYISNDLLFVELDNIF